MTASVSTPEKLPLWRAIAGFGALGILVTLLVVAGLAYLDNYRLDGYMRTVAADPASGGAADDALRARILDRAAQLGLPVRSSDVKVTRDGGRLRIRIEKYGLQTPVVRMDLRMPAAESH